MKAAILAVGVVLGALAAAAPAEAQTCYPLIPQTPPTCWYQQNYFGQWCGPNCYMYPPYPPFQGMVFAAPRPPVAPGMPPRPGMVPVPGGPPVLAMPGYGGTVAFPSHQWARSPRDFFMID
jgi:hypothetical protein